MEDILPYIPAAIGAAGVLGSMSSEQQASKDRKASREQLQQVIDQIKGIPDPQLQQYALEQYTNQYNFTPEDVQAVQQQVSGLSGYKADPALRQSQMDALSQLGQLSKGGLTNADQAAIQDINLQNASQDQGNQQAIQQDLARRGMAGSGQELASRMISSQGAADRSAEQSRAVLQSSQQRALQALGQQAGLASQLRGQDFGEQEKIAQAQDAINRFNTANRQNVLAGNVGARNMANREQVLQQQGIANQNVDVRNRNQAQPNDLNQQRYNNVMNRYGVMMGGANNAGQMGMQAATAANQGRYNQINAISGAAKQGYSAYNQPDQPVPASQYDQLMEQDKQKRQSLYDQNSNIV